MTDEIMKTLIQIDERQKQTSKNLDALRAEFHDHVKHDDDQIGGIYEHVGRLHKETNAQIAGVKEVIAEKSTATSEHIGKVRGVMIAGAILIPIITSLLVLLLKKLGA